MPSVRDRRRRVDREVQRLQELLGRDVDAAQPVEEVLAAEIEVLRHRHGGHQAGLLEHHGDAGVQRLGRRRELHGLAAMQHAPRCRLDHAGHDLGQRRLAGAVLAEQRVDLARAQVEVDVLDGGRAVIGLRDLLHLDDRSHGITASWRMALPPFDVTSTRPSRSTALVIPWRRPLARLWKLATGRRLRSSRTSRP